MHRAVAQMDVPVVGPAQGDRVHSLRHFFTHIRIERRGRGGHGYLAEPRSARWRDDMSGCIVGWAHSKFGKHEGKDIE